MSDSTSDFLNDDALLAAFESCSLAPASWNHKAHVRVAYLYLVRDSLAGATVRMRQRLLALNAAHGVPDAPGRGYHETITVAFMRWIASRMAGTQHETSTHFCDAQADLLDRQALLRFYSRERLMSAEARRKFVEPDLAPLP